MIKRVLTLVLAAALAVSIFAQDEAPASVVGKFETMYPKTIFKEIRKSQVSELYEVVMGKNAAYTDESDRYFIFEHLFDMHRQVDLTTQRKFDGKKTKFLTQQLGQAIKTVKGDGDQIPAVFSDPGCPYCKQLEGELAHLDNVTVYTFLHPLESLHPEAKAKAISVWCTPNKAKAWSKLMLVGKKPKPVACNSPTNDNLVLGSKLGMVGTPTLVVADGRVLPGSAPAEKIDQWLNAGKPGAPVTAQEATQ